MENGYQVIARRWRPRQFDELVGQEHIVRTLSNAIETKRIAHAYLFVGPRGTGKTSTARLFAKALNAEGGPCIHPDNNSEISREIMAGTCMDVIEIDGASNNSVDQIRDLRDDCQYAPSRCRFKIYIIDEVHMLSNNAFNALLKTLEEPPPHVKFFFATTEANKVLDTIVSRCQRFEFRPIGEAVIADKLAQIAEAETIEVSREALTAIARLANGGMRDAQSIFDQMISFCGNKIDENDVLEVYGLVAAADIDALAQAMAQMNYGKIVHVVEKLIDDGRDLYRALVDLEAKLRMVLLDAIANQGESELLGVPLRNEQILRMMDAVHGGIPAVQRGLSERANFEIVLLKASEESRSRAIDSLLHRLTIPTVGSEKKKP
jgi:DNA polymerase-3 subunit gamma/tau